MQDVAFLLRTICLNWLTNIIGIVYALISCKVKLPSFSFEFTKFDEAFLHLWKRIEYAEIFKNTVNMAVFTNFNFCAITNREVVDLTLLTCCSVVCSVLVDYWIGLVCCLIIYWFNFVRWIWILIYCGRWRLILI